ncbi:MAG: hypothetical protein ACYDAO_01740 [Thermoplasmataceae archaeon]
MEISVGQSIDIEIDNEDIMTGYKKNLIVTWYQKGFPIYVEMVLNKSFFTALKKYVSVAKGTNSIISVYRKSRTKYVIEPAIVIINKDANRNLATK